MISVQPKYHWASTFSPEFGTPNGVHQGLAREVYMSTEYHSRQRMLTVINAIQEKVPGWR